MQNDCYGRHCSHHGHRVCRAEEAGWEHTEIPLDACTDVLSDSLSRWRVLSGLLKSTQRLRAILPIWLCSQISLSWSPWRLPPCLSFSQRHLIIITFSLSMLTHILHHCPSQQSIEAVASRSLSHLPALAIASKTSHKLGLRGIAPFSEPKEPGCRSAPPGHAHLTDFPLHISECLQSSTSVTGRKEWHLRYGLYSSHTTQDKTGKKASRDQRNQHKECLKMCPVREHAYLSRWRTKDVQTFGTRWNGSRDGSHVSIRQVLSDL